MTDGRWGAVQVRMGSHLFDEAADKLISFSNKVDKKTIGEPSFLAIISATEYAYIREDGVYVIPIGCLKE